MCLGGAKSSSGLVRTSLWHIALDHPNDKCLKSRPETPLATRLIQIRTYVMLVHDNDCE